MSFFRALKKQMSSDAEAAADVDAGSTVPARPPRQESLKPRRRPGEIAPSGPDALNRSEAASDNVPVVKLSRRTRIEDAPYHEFVSVDMASMKILSASGELAANADQGQFVCFLSDGRLLIAKGYEHNQHVMTYVTLLTRRNVEHRVVRTTVRTIVNIQQQAGLLGADLGARTHTAMQAAASKILNEATGLGASDIHIRVDKRGTDILYRVNGELEKFHERDHEFGMKLIRYYYQAMADTSEETFKETMRLDARIGDRTKLPERLNGIRIATTPTVEASLMVMRLLYEDTSQTTDPCELGFTEEQRAQIEYMQEQPIGIAVISGPTGSGKSTTLQKVLRGYIQRTEGRRHVITVEDPPEYPIPGAQQTPVGNASSQEERSEMFIAAISSAMRLDPDTVMIGEVRDLPSAELAFRAATTGHQVWTTLHANSALAIVSRLVNIGLDSDLFLDHTILIGLIGQRLIKKLCPHCKKPLLKHMHEIDSKVLDRTRTAVGDDLDLVYITGDGCEHCRGGTAGRTVVAEIVVPNAKLCEILRTGDYVKAYNYWQNDMRGMSIVQHAVEKIRQGIVDPVMAERVVGSLAAASVRNLTGEEI